MFPRSIDASVPKVKLEFMLPHAEKTWGAPGKAPDNLLLLQVGKGGRVWNVLLGNRKTGAGIRGSGAWWGGKWAQYIENTHSLGTIQLLTLWYYISSYPSLNFLPSQEPGWGISDGTTETGWGFPASAPKHRDITFRNTREQIALFPVPSSPWCTQ